MPSPNEIASSVLALLAERGLPPTPANYAHAYAEVSGEPETAISEESNELLQLVHSLVDLVVSRTGSLSDSLVEKNQDMKQTVDALHAAKEKDLIIRLAQALTAKADSIHLSVSETQRDLASTRDTLQRMSTELTETRQSLLEGIIVLHNQ